MKTLKKALPALKIVISISSGIFFLYGIFYGFQKVVENRKYPTLKYDLNNDNLVSIRDIFTAFWEMFKGPGRMVQEFIATHFESFAQFFEMNAKEPSTFWSCIFTIAVMTLIKMEL